MARWPARAVIGTSIAFLVGCAPGGARDRYVERNEELLATIPTFPGAVHLETTSSPYFREGGGGPIGYATRHSFGLPEHASRLEVAAFYKRRLAGEWSLFEELIEARGERVLNVCRGGGSVSVNLESATILEIGVDYDAFGKEGHPKSCASLVSRS